MEALTVRSDVLPMLLIICDRLLLTRIDGSYFFLRINLRLVVVVFLLSQKLVHRISQVVQNQVSLQIVVAIFASYSILVCSNSISEPSVNLSNPVSRESFPVEGSDKVKRRTKRPNFGTEPERLQVSIKRANFTHKGHRLAVAVPKFAKFSPTTQMEKRLVDHKIVPEDIDFIQDFINSHFKS